MRSRITIEIDWDNQPIIRINYLASEDVRDALVKRFLETFGESSIAHFSCYNSQAEPFLFATIRPLTMQVLARDSGFYKKQIADAIKAHPNEVMQPVVE